MSEYKNPACIQTQALTPPSSEASAPIQASDLLVFTDEHSHEIARDHLKGRPAPLLTPESSSSFETRWEFESLGGNEASLDALFDKGQQAILTLHRTVTHQDASEKLETLTLRIHSHKEWQRIQTAIENDTDYDITQVFFSTPQALRKAYGNDLDKVRVPQPVWPSIFIYSLALGITNGLWQMASFLVISLQASALTSQIGSVFAFGLGSCLWVAALTGILDVGLRYGRLWHHQGFMPTRAQTLALGKDSVWLMLKMFGSMALYTLAYVGLRSLSAQTGFLSDIALAALVAISCSVTVTALTAIAARRAGKPWKEVAWDAASLFAAAFTASFAWTLLSLFAPGGQVAASVITAVVVSSSFIVWPAAFTAAAMLYENTKTLRQNAVTIPTNKPSSEDRHLESDPDSGLSTRTTSSISSLTFSDRMSGKTYQLSTQPDVFKNERSTVTRLKLKS